MKPSTLAIVALFFSATTALAIAMSSSDGDDTQEDEAIQALQQAADPDANRDLQRAVDW